MLFSQDRKQIRQVFFNAWKKRRDGAPLEPMEAIISDVVAQHPEYHRLLENPDANLDKDFSPESGETNPFLHMSLHITIAEQRSSRQPPIINEVYQHLSLKYGDPHKAEHDIMDCIVEMLWQMQRKKSTAPDQEAYLKCLQGKMQTTPND